MKREAGGQWLIRPLGMGLVRCNWEGVRDAGEMDKLIGAIKGGALQERKGDFRDKK